MQDFTKLLPAPDKTNARVTTPLQYFYREAHENKLDSFALFPMQADLQPYARF
jgi:hypothetical protein